MNDNTTATDSLSRVFYVSRKDLDAKSERAFKACHDGGILRDFHTCANSYADQLEEENRGLKMALNMVSRVMGQPSDTLTHQQVRSMLDVVNGELARADNAEDNGGG